MELHAVVPQAPVIPWASVPVGHDAVDAQGLETCRESDGTICMLDQSRMGIPTYALPAPMIKTSVSKLDAPSNDLFGDRKSASFSGWMSRLSSLVLNIQILQAIVSPSLTTGNKSILPRPSAAGDSVLNTRGQSMNC